MMFTHDNTEGFTNAQLAAMNDEFHHNLQIALADLPDGVECADDDTLAQIKQTVATEVLRNHGAA
jgi:hypothetical protein